MKYEVTMRVTITKTFVVEADNEDDAYFAVDEVFDTTAYGGETYDHGDGVVELVTKERYRHEFLDIRAL